MNRFALIAAALAATAGIQASDIDYTFVQIEAFKADDPAAVNLTTGTGFGTDLGFELSGSYGINDMFYVNGSYGSTTYADILDITETTLGFGYILGLSDNTDANFELAYVNLDFDLLGLGSDTDGYRFTLGFRNRTADDWEVNFRMSSTQLDIDNYAEVELGMRYLMNDSMSVGVDVGLARYVGETMSEFGVSFRYAF